MDDASLKTSDSAAPGAVHANPAAGSPKVPAGRPTTAVGVLRLARSRGINIVPDGDTLSLTAPVKQPPDVLALIERFKPDILKILRAPRRRSVDWDTLDWKYWFYERVLFFRREHRKSREQAVSMSHTGAVALWCSLNPYRGPAKVCAGCGKWVRGKTFIVCPDGAAIHYGGQYRLRCFYRHGHKRREQPMEALKALGICQ